MNDSETSFLVVVFASTTYVLKAEKILKNIGVPYKLIPVPRHISSDCGVCIRFMKQDLEKVEQALQDKAEIIGIIPV